MGRFQRRNDTFPPRERLEGIQGGSVANDSVMHAADFRQMGMFRAHAGIIQPGGDGVGGLYLAVLVL